MNISKPIIYLWTNVIYAQYITLVDFQGLLKTSEDPLGVLTMYKFIDKAFKLGNCLLHKLVCIFIAYKLMGSHIILLSGSFNLYNIPKYTSDMQ